MSYLVYQNNNPKGIFNDIEICKDYIKSIEENGWATNFKIVKYKTNSFIKIFDKNISYLNKKNGFEDNSVKAKVNYDYSNSDSSESDKNNLSDLIINVEEIKKKKVEMTKNAKEQQKDQARINILNLQKEKILESKNKYEVDLKLYNKFKGLIKNDIDFVIPDIFIDKFNILKELDDKDILSWDNFAKIYKESDFNGNYANVFEVSNDYDKKFYNLQNNGSDSSENTSDSYSDSGSEDSENEDIEHLDSSEES